MNGGAMTHSCVAVRHVAFEDLGLLGPLLGARDYDVRCRDAGVEALAADALLAEIENMCKPDENSRPALEP